MVLKQVTKMGEPYANIGLPPYRFSQGGKGLFCPTCLKVGTLFNPLIFHIELNALADFIAFFCLKFAIPLFDSLSP